MNFVCYLITKEDFFNGILRLFCQIQVQLARLLRVIEAVSQFGYFHSYLSYLEDDSSNEECYLRSKKE